MEISEISLTASASAGQRCSALDLRFRVKNITRFLRERASAVFFLQSHIRLLVSPFHSAGRTDLQANVALEEENCEGGSSCEATFMLAMFPCGLTSENLDRHLRLVIALYVPRLKLADRRRKEPFLLTCWTVF